MRRKCSTPHPRENSGNVGAEGEVRVVLDLMQKGWEVFRAISPSATVDLVGIKDGLMSRIEVTKGRRGGRGQWLVWAPHDRTRYDILAVWEREGGITYLSAFQTTQNRWPQRQS